MSSLAGVSSAHVAYGAALPRCHRGVCGRLRSHFFHSVAVSDGAAIGYIDTKALVRQLTCASPHQARLQRDGRIMELLRLNLTPIAGQPLDGATLAATMTALRSDALVTAALTQSDGAAAAALLTRRLEERRDQEQHMVVAWDPAHLEEILQPGDILLRKYHPSEHNPIVTAQKLLYPLHSEDKDYEGYRYTHAAIYVGKRDGKGTIVEASWPGALGDEIREIHLDDERFALTDATPYQYLVIRPKKYGAEAAAIAQQLATYLPPCEDDNAPAQKTRLRYTRLGGLRSLYHSACFTLFGRYRYLKQYADYEGYLSAATTNPQAQFKLNDYLMPKRLFCSYLVGMCYQVAEGHDKLPAMMQKDATPWRCPKVHMLDNLLKGLWSRVMRLKHWSAMGRQLDYRFDAKFLSPQNMRNLPIRRPDLYEEVCLVNPAP